MAKSTNTVFFCTECGYESVKWMGQCPGCKSWNSFVEEPKERTTKGRNYKNSNLVDIKHNEPVCFSKVTLDETKRISTQMPELDRVLGGGIVPGSLTLVGGDPGIGKSTLLLQLCKELSDKGLKVLYVSGEESVKQIKIRGDRIGQFADGLLLLCETNLQTITEQIKKHSPAVVIIDSIQTMYNEEVGAAPGSVSQVRESTGVLLQLAKGLNISVFVVGHVTKEGTVGTYGGYCIIF